MASPAQIILFLACAYLAECRLRGKFDKEHKSLNEHKIQETSEHSVTEHPVVSTIKTNEDFLATKTSRDEDAIFFPKDQDIKVYLDVNKIIRDTFNKMGINNKNKAASTTYVPLLPKVVPALEAKEAFTNPIIVKDEEITHKTKDDGNIQTSPKSIKELTEAKIEIDAVMKDNSNNKLDNNMTVSMGNDTSRSSETVPDFSSRFGVTGNYVIIPANDAQTYQALQVPNDVQGNVQQYGTYSGQGNTINPSNGAAQFATPNGIINNPNPQYIQNTNALQNPNVPSSNINYNGIQQSTVPISVGNTYMINGQLYAAVTVPNNVNVPRSLYLINSQQHGSGHQVNNDLPLYKLVSVRQGEQRNANQYVPINGNGNNQYVPVNGNVNDQYGPINGNGNNQYVPIYENGNNQYVPANGNVNDLYVPVNGNVNDQYVPVNGNGNNQYVPVNGNVNNQYVPVNGNVNNQYVPIYENGNNQYVPAKGNVNDQYVPVNGNVNDQYVPVNRNGNNQYVPINGNVNNQHGIN